MKNEKKILRQKYLDLRNSLSLEEIESKSKSITDILLKSSYYKNAEKIFTYIEMNSEVKTTMLINKALEDGKIVAVPVSVPKTLKMFFVQIKSLDNLKDGVYGTKIPVYNDSDIIESDDKTLFIVPGVAFDDDNYRLGYGGGYYDAYLEKNIYAKTIGVCFDIQKTEKLIVENFDVRLDLVISF